MNIATVHDLPASYRARSQAYRLPIHSNWYKATISHNTVLVDRRSQKPAAGKLMVFECENDYTVVAAACSEANPGVEHTRHLVMTGTYLLVFDTLRSDAEHRFDWIYHNKGDRVVCDVAGDAVNRADKYPGGEYIQNSRQGTTGEMFCARFEDSEVTTHLTVAAHEDTVVTVGEGVGSSIADRVPMIMVGRDGREANFAAVLEPVAAGNKPRVDGVRFTRTREALMISVQRGGQTDNMSILPDKRVLVALSAQLVQ